MKKRTWRKRKPARSVPKPVAFFSGRGALRLLCGEGVQGRKKHGCSVYDEAVDEYDGDEQQRSHEGRECNSEHHESVEHSWSAMLKITRAPSSTH